MASDSNDAINSAEAEARVPLADSCESKSSTDEDVMEDEDYGNRPPDSMLMPRWLSNGSEEYQQVLVHIARILWSVCIDLRSDPVEFAVDLAYLLYDKEKFKEEVERLPPLFPGEEIGTIYEPAMIDEHPLVITDTEGTVMNAPETAAAQETYHKAIDILLQRLEKLKPETDTASAVTAEGGEGSEDGEIEESNMDKSEIEESVHSDIEEDMLPPPAPCKEPPKPPPPVIAAIPVPTRPTQSVPPPPSAPIPNMTKQPGPAPPLPTQVRSYQGIAPQAPRVYQSQHNPWTVPYVSPPQQQRQNDIPMLPHPKAHVDQLHENTRNVSTEGRFAHIGPPPPGPPAAPVPYKPRFPTQQQQQPRLYVPPLDSSMPHFNQSLNRPRFDPSHEPPAPPAGQINGPNPPPYQPRRANYYVHKPFSWETS